MNVKQRSLNFCYCCNFNLSWECPGCSYSSSNKARICGDLPVDCLLSFLHFDWGNVWSFQLLLVALIMKTEGACVCVWEHSHKFVRTFNYFLIKSFVNEWFTSKTGHPKYYADWWQTNVTQFPNGFIKTSRCCLPSQLFSLSTPNPSERGPKTIHSYWQHQVCVCGNSLKL